MTEKEFLEGVRAEIVAGKPVDTVARSMAIRAGVEFAPEPVRLPERLVLDMRHSSAGPPTSAAATNPDYACFEIVRNKMPDCPTTAFRMEVLAAAVARYNAYPGLREAAERVVNVVGERVGYSGAMDNLAAELAKGPK